MLHVLSALALALAPTAACASPQQAAPASDVPVQAPPEARAVWDELCRASGSATREPLRAFTLRAEVRVRSGVQVNDTRVDYRYLAPDCIRFVLPSNNETGRFGPAPEQYWLQSRDDVVVLAGREYKEDRRKVDDMIALARNYVALSNPARLQLSALELAPGPPADLGPELAARFKKLTWLTLESSDFALVRSEEVRPAGTVYRVELGLNKDHLPAVAIVRERGMSRTDPLLVQLSDYQERDGFRIPFQLRVHVLDRSSTPATFAKEASQEVYVTQAELRPTLTVEDFKPRK